MKRAAAIAAFIFGAVVAAAESPAEGDLPTGATLRLGSASFRPGACVTWITGIGESRLGMASGTLEEEFTVWSLPDGQRLSSWKVSEDWTQSAVSGDGARVAVETRNGISIRDMMTGKEISVVTGTSYPEHLAFSAKARQVGFGDSGKRLLVADAETGNVLWSHDGGARLSALEFSPSGNRVAAVFVHDEITLLDSSTGDALGTWKVECKEISQLAWSPDARRIAVACSDSHIRIIDAATGKLDGECDGGDWQYTGLTWSPAGRNLAALETWSGIDIFDTKDFSRVTRLEARTGEFASLSYCGGGKFLAVSDGERTRLAEVATWRWLPEAPGHDGGVCTLEFSPDGTELLSSGPYGGASIWSLADRAGRRLLPTGDQRIRTGAAFVSGSKAVALQGPSKLRGGSVFILDASNGKEVARAEVEDMVCVVCASPAGDKVAIGCRYSAVVVDAHAAQRLSEWAPSQDASDRVGFLHDGKWSRDGSIVAWLGEDGMALVDPATGSTVRFLGSRPPDHDPEDLMPRSIALSRELRSFYLTGGDRIDALELLTGQKAGSWQPVEAAEKERARSHGSVILDAELSPDDSILALGMSEGPALLLLASTGKVLCRLEGHHGGSEAVAFSADGRLLATGGSDGTILVWDLTAIKADRCSVLPAPAPDTDLRPLLERLTGIDLAASWEASARLESAGPRALPLLAAAADPGPIPPATPRLALLVSRLDDPDAQVRSGAKDTLLDRGAEAEGALLDAMKNPASTEQKASAAELLARLLELLPSDPAALGRLRAIAAIERIGGPESVAALDRLARPEVPAREREEARKSRDRLRHFQK